MNPDPEIERTAAWMRRDWEERARADALRSVYTRDAAGDEADFDRSGRANYDQLVRPYLPVLLSGRRAADCRVVEIGCGLGRMTQWFAAEFGRVHAVDVSKAMLEGARARLAGRGNVRFHEGTGYDLRFLPDDSVDLAFSYIVFQHIPAREVIQSYIRDTARALKPGGAFKFQLNGDQSPEYRAHARDTWLGETFSAEEVSELLRGAGLSLLASEGAGTQYFVITARKGPPPPGPRPYLLPCEPWAGAQIGVGWGPPMDGGWRPVAARATARLAVPAGGGLRIFAGLYFWPPGDRHDLQLSLDGSLCGRWEVTAAGDTYLEAAAPACPRAMANVELTIQPAGERQPALRCLGLYRPL
jgi:SAM-dependent methyltransferase